MKVFISHKSEDSSRAAQIDSYLKIIGVSTYLDVLDAVTSSNGKELTDHIKEALNTCTDILVVMSENTRYSQWVPFEIGMSAQIDMPTVTFLDAEVQLPEFLSYWPRLKRISDLSMYVSMRNKVHSEMEQRYGRSFEISSSRKAEEVRTFYGNLKSVLR